MALQLAGQTLNYQIPKIKVALESYKAYKEGYRIIVNQGGTRSGKTYTLNQLLIALALKEKCTISITSVAFPHLRRGAMRDWRQIMENSGLYDANSHIRTEQVYNYPNGSYIEFFSADNNLKVRGPGRDILFFNEANLTSFDTFTQLMLRTRKAIFIDFNPADEFHWIYDSILTRPDAYFIKSTYKDNPYLPPEQVREIENLKNVDENFWRIYGEGERGHSEGVIYTHWKPYSAIPDGSSVFGLDFGYNNPTALVRVRENDKNLYASEEIYQTHLTNQDLIPMIKQIVKPHETIYCDTAEPARIEELKRAGIKALPANKDVKAGILFLKSRGLFIDQTSVNLMKEIKSYKYMGQKKNKNEPEEPLKLNDHCFTGDTLVFTSNGVVAINEIEEGDWVYTSGGLRPVLKLWNNGQKQIKDYWLHLDTISVHLSCTPDHLIKTNKGWIEISKLKSGMIVNLISSLRAESLSYSQANAIFDALNGQCIQEYGNILTESAHQDTMCIIKTKTRGIMNPVILNSYDPTSTYLTTSNYVTSEILNGVKNFMQKALRQLKNGINLLREFNGIPITRENQISVILSMDKEFVKYAPESLLNDLKPKSFVIKTAKLKRLEEGESRLEQVYDLTVAGEHEYFANGVLVHNCMDAMRYAAISFKKPKATMHTSFHKV